MYFFFFGGGTKLRTACNALLKLSSFPQLHEHNLSPRFLLLPPTHSFSLSAGWHLSADTVETSFDLPLSSFLDLPLRP